MPTSQAVPTAESTEAGSLRRILEAQRAEDAAYLRWEAAKDEAKEAKDAYEDARDHRKAVILEETANERPLLDGQAEA